MIAQRILSLAGLTKRNSFYYLRNKKLIWPN